MNWTLLGAPHKRVARDFFNRGRVRGVNPDGLQGEEQAQEEDEEAEDEQVEANHEFEAVEEEPDEDDEWPPTRNSWRAMRRDMRELRHQNNEIHGWMRGVYFDKFPNQQPSQDPDA
ncbi:hypothetical protein ACS0TY_036122 [Phlomoides rotata]